MIGPSLIIDRSGTQPAWARVLDWVLSALAWLLYLYLVSAALMDLYVLANETVDWLFAGGARPLVPEVSRFFSTLWTYFIVAVANGMILIAWARYNQYRFRGQQQRCTTSVVSVADLATLYRVSDADVARWQATRILAMQHDVAGTLLRVTSGEPSQTTPVATGVATLAPTIDNAARV